MNLFVFSFFLLCSFDVLSQVPREEQLTVQVWLNRDPPVFQNGDTIRVFMNTNKDCYLRLIYHDAEGKNVIIFPNYRSRDDKVQGGKDYVVPTAFLARLPFGSEELIAFVSTEKFPDVNVTDRGDGLVLLEDSLNIFTEKFRANGIFGEYAERRILVKTVTEREEKILTPPEIEITSPSPSDFAVVNDSTATIQGVVKSKIPIRSVSLKQKGLSVGILGSQGSFSFHVRLASGENKFLIVAEDNRGHEWSRELIIKWENKFNGQRWAVVIGISQYQHPEIPKLKYAHRDAQEFYDFLRSPNGGAFSDDHILLLLNEQAVRKNLENAMFQFLSRTDPNDLVVIFYSGHGSTLGKENAYFVTYDANPYDFENSAFKMKNIQKAMESSIQAERVIVFADACFSGSVNTYIKGKRGPVEENLINRYLIEMAKTRPGIISFTSSAEGEFSKEGWFYWEHGLFTYFLISGLGGKVTDTQGRVQKSVPADKNGDGIVTVGEIIEYVTSAVAKMSGDQQHPQISRTNFDQNLPLSVIR